MANLNRRKSQIIKNSKELVSSTIATAKNTAVIAENLTGLLADASDVLREKTPDLVSKWIEDAKETSGLENQIESDELKIQAIETAKRLKELEESK